MSAATIQAALDQRLYDSQNALIDIAWEGKPYTPAQDTPHLKPTMLARTSAPQGAGATGTVLWSGRYQILVNNAVGHGMDDVGAKAEELRQLFRRGTNLTTTDGWSVVVEAVDVPPAIQGDAWLTVPVVVRWWSLEFPT
jgi:hypothetical protein